MSSLQQAVALLQSRDFRLSPEFQSRREALSCVNHGRSDPNSEGRAATAIMTKFGNPQILWDVAH